MQYGSDPLSPSLDPIWPNQLCYKETLQQHAHTHAQRHLVWIDWLVQSLVVKRPPIKMGNYKGLSDCGGGESAPLPSATALPL